MFRLRNNFLPITCMRYVSANTVCVYNIRKRSYFKIKSYLTTFRQFSVSISGPKLWDSLPSDITDLYFIGAFKMALASLYCFVLVGYACVYFLLIFSFVPCVGPTIFKFAFIYYFL